jgi:HlyD family secretion protein
MGVIRQPNSKARHRRPLAAALAPVMALLLAACSVAPAGQPPVAPVAVKTTAVGTGTIAGTLVYSGNAQSRAKVSLLPKVGGQVAVLNAEVGASVKKGDVIAELDHAAQDAQVAQAQAGVAAAKAHLATLQAGPRAEVVAQAQSNLTAAEQTLANLQSGGRPEAIAAAQGNVDAAAGRLANLQSGRPESIAAAQGNVDAAAGRLASLQSGRSETVAQATANLHAAQAKLQQIKDGPTPEEIKAAQLGVEQTKDAAFAADVSKDAACGPASTSAMCKAGEASADAAHTAVDQANANLQVLVAPPSDQTIKQAQAAVDAAQAQLDLARHPASSGDITAAAGALDAAKAQLDLTKLPYSTADLAKAQSAVEVATQQVKLAQAPYTSQDIDVATAAVEQAQAALTSANVARDQAIVKAPIDAIVAQKLLTVGSIAGPTTPIALLIDPNVDIIVEADATQVNTLKVGDPATITSDALPGKSVPGKITTISPIVDAKARTAEITIAPAADGSGFKDGMLAQVSLVVATHDGVLTVPSAAVVQRNGQSVVFVVTNNVAQPVAVQTGLTDGTSTEITSGLQAGQTVVVGGQDRLIGSQPVTVQN